METSKIKFNDWIVITMGALSGTAGTLCMAAVIAPDYTWFAGLFGILWWFLVDYSIVANKDAGGMAMILRVAMVLCFAVVSSAAVDAYVFKDEIDALKSGAKVSVYNDPQYKDLKSQEDFAYNEYNIERNIGYCGPECDKKYKIYTAAVSKTTDFVEGYKTVKGKNSIFSDQKLAYNAAKTEGNLLSFWAFTIMLPLLELTPLAVKIDKVLKEKRKLRKQRKYEEENPPPPPPLPPITYKTTPWA